MFSPASWSPFSPLRSCTGRGSRAPSQACYSSAHSRNAMGEDMRETAVLRRLKQGYTVGARTLASRSVVGLARTRVTPNALTTAGVSLCLAAAVLVYFEDHDKLLFYWLGAFVFFVDSTTDRVGEGAMLGAIALIFARHGNEVALGATIAAIAGSFLVSYTRAKAEALGL